MSRATARLISGKTAGSGSPAAKLRSLFASCMLINTKRDPVKELIIEAVEIKFDSHARSPNRFYLVLRRPKYNYVAPTQFNRSG